MCLAVARFGDIADIPAARKFLNAAATTSDVRSTPANSRLFEAFAASRTGDAATAVEKAGEAAVRYREIGWPHFEAQALEIAGKPVEALDIYKRIGALRDFRRLDERSTPSTNAAVPKVSLRLGSARSATCSCRARPTRRSPRSWS